MRLEQTLNILNQIGLHGNENHHIILEVDDWFLVLGSICGIAIQKNKEDIPEHKTSEYLEKIEEDGTFEMANSGYTCYELSEDDDYWYCDNPTRGCFDSFWLSDKVEVAQEAFRMKIHGFRYLEKVHTMPFKKIEI